MWDATYPRDSGDLMNGFTFTVGRGRRGLIIHEGSSVYRIFKRSIRGELLSPCRCDGSVRCTHQPCLIRWISERGSWSCELCYFKYQVLAISTKNPLQVSGGSPGGAAPRPTPAKSQTAHAPTCRLPPGISPLPPTSLPPGLIIHEGSSVYRIFKRWQAVNQQWKVLNYDKTRDLGEPVGGAAAKAGGRNSRTNPSSGRERNPRRGQLGRTILNLLHILSHLRPNEHRGGASSGREVVMRVTTV
nr:E3 ubiquitin-protein ligase MARCH9 [Pelodiscus sinensis]|eukprot:XP_025035717.1 E3 ubiquitin-protein ligase MARCH9 [Pelodiscus sinensis]